MFSVGGDLDDVVGAFQSIQITVRYRPRVILNVNRQSELSKKSELNNAVYNVNEIWVLFQKNATT